MVQTYLEWVTQQPELARFMFQARSAVADGPFDPDLAQRNKERLGGILQWLDLGLTDGSMRALPRETYAALLIGAIRKLLQDLVIRTREKQADRI